MSHYFNRFGCIIAFLLFFTQSGYSNVISVGAPFGDNMVLQRCEKVNIWGKAPANALLTIEVFSSEKKRIVSKKEKSNRDGSWQATLPSLKAQVGCELRIICYQDSLVLKNIAFGEVWIAGGQSNMAWTLKGISDPHGDIVKATNENIRFLNVPRISDKKIAEHTPWNWQSATSEYVGGCSALAYYFCKKLEEQLNVPIGVIVCAHGSTYAECWTDWKSLEENPVLSPIMERYHREYDQNRVNYDSLYTAAERKKKEVDEARKRGQQVASINIPMGPKHYLRPGGLYKTMFLPLHGLSVRGVIWYQGEANVRRAEQYHELFPMVINTWRRDMQSSTLPFYFVQLSNFYQKGEPYWAELREAQLKTVQRVKHTGMVVSIDCGERENIHPKDKRIVANRLADIALNKQYHRKRICSGPLFKSAKIAKDKIIIDFTHKGSGLTGNLRGFLICGTDKKFITANAIIYKNKVHVWSESVKNPVAVRYAWNNWAQYGLYNKEGFPASPFRTDHFRLHSAERR